MRFRGDYEEDLGINGIRDIVVVIIAIPCFLLDGLATILFVCRDPDEVIGTGTKVLDLLRNGTALLLCLLSLPLSLVATLIILTEGGPV